MRREPKHREEGTESRSSSWMQHLGPRTLEPWWGTGDWLYWYAA